MDLIWQIIIWIIIGGIAGWVASLIMKEGLSLVGAIIVGIIGAIIGGFIVGLFGLDADGGFIWSIIVAIIGAVILLFILGLVRRAA